LDSYVGRFGDCLHAFAIAKQESSLRIIHAWREGSALQEREE
jgi:hypothetical protein